MKITLFTGFFFLSLTVFSQSPRDSVIMPLDSFKVWEKNPKASVVLVSGSESITGRDSSTWDHRWQNYIDKQSLKIAEKVLMADSTKRTYKVVLDFFINENGTRKDLKITCSPSNKLIESECYTMVTGAPKKLPEYRNGKYVRPHIQQPIEIKIKGTL
jgi:hypothetical protein